MSQKLHSEILKYFLILFFITIFQPFTSTHAQTTTQNLQNDISETNCKLGECWNTLFPQIKALAEDGLKIVHEYQISFYNNLSKIQKAQTPLQEELNYNLNYELQILKAYLAECEDLSHDYAHPDLAAKYPRRLIIVGKHFRDDGENFMKAAVTEKIKFQQKICGVPQNSIEWQYCASRIIIKSDLSKDRLLQYFKTLENDSLETVSYFGHGIELGLILGPKDLLLPSKWTNNIKIPYKEWTALNQGMFYAKDLDGPLGDELSRVMSKKPQSEINLYACNAGKCFARELKTKNKATSISAATNTMYFKYVDIHGEHSPGRYPVPDGPHYTVMHTRKPSDFGVIANGNEEPLKDPEQVTANYEQLDQITRDIVFRLAWYSSDRVTLPSGETLLFTQEERTLLYNIFKHSIDKHGWTDDSILAKHIYFEIDSERFRCQSKIKNQEEVEKNKNSLLLLDRFKEKLEKCTQEGIKTYYLK